ncbi:hypothetical protein SLS61_009707 [Didymella pomorum]
MSSAVVVVSLTAAALTVLYLYFNNTRHLEDTQITLRKLPLIGDLHQSPIAKPLSNWSAWSKDNGPITKAKLFGIVPIIVINSYEALTELFSRRSQWYSNRPASVSLEMITGAEPGRSRFTLMHDYDEHLKLHHRILSPSLGAPAASQYQPLMELEPKQLLFDLVSTLKKTNDGSSIDTKTVFPLLERTQSSVILALHYGLRIPKFEEPFLHEILWLFVAVIQNPEFMARAHEVLDKVVGRDRLPRFSDRNGLAYIDVVAHELFRWRPISPGSIPRRAEHADESAGVKIAKGVTIMANSWAIGRDEKVVDSSLGNVEDFLPERWLRDGRLRSDLPLPVFGQGRRICQGKRVATDGIFMNITHLLWAFDVEAVLGEEVDPWAMVVVGFMTEPRPFKFRLKPRGQWALDVIKREWANSEKSLDRVMGLAHDVEK